MFEDSNKIQTCVKTHLTQFLNVIMNSKSWTLTRLSKYTEAHLAAVPAAWITGDFLLLLDLKFYCLTSKEIKSFINLLDWTAINCPVVFLEKWGYWVTAFNRWFLEWDLDHLYFDRFLASALHLERYSQSPAWIIVLASFSVVSKREKKTIHGSVHLLLISKTKKCFSKGKQEKKW